MDAVTSAFGRAGGGGAAGGDATDGWAAYQTANPVSRHTTVMMIPKVRGLFLMFSRT